MATEQRAERLSLVEPANLPDRPFSPNRPLLAAAGAAGGLALGLLLALGLELLGKPIRSPRQLEQLDLPVIGLVPLIKAKPQPRTGRFPGMFSREKRLAA
jgi:capsular polysaccharide biosynthesis protein